MYKTLIAEIGRLVKSALPFAIVDGNPSNGFAALLSHRSIASATSAGNTLVFVAAGTYAGQTNTQDDITIIFSGGAILDGTTAAHAFNNSGDNCVFIGGKFRTTTLGGSSYHGIVNTGARCTFLAPQVLGSDDLGINDTGTFSKYIAPIVSQSDNQGLKLYGGGGICVGGNFWASSNGIQCDTGSNQVLVANYVGNGATIRIDSAASANGIAIGNAIDATLSDGGSGWTVSPNEVF